MRYYCIHIQTDFSEEWRKDLFEQQLFDLGVDTIDADQYYIPMEAWQTHGAEIEALCAETDDVKWKGAETCEDKNWNAVWEAEHPIQELPLGVRIVPHCAFGAGHHETTAMMMEALMDTDLSGQSVLDHGTGTGVLAIFTKKRGAAQVVAIDIDDKSVQNARENAAFNNVEIDVRLGSSIEGLGTFNLILANIHRNVLLAQMPLYAIGLLPDGQLWLSGFYEADCSPLMEAATKQGLQLIATHQNGEWRMLQFRKK